jgi:hypothetical protein
VRVVLARDRRVRVVMAGLLLLAACGEPTITDQSPSTVSTATTSTATTEPPTTTVTEPAYQPAPIDEIDTGAANEVFFPRTEAEGAAWGDRHNYPPDQPGLVTLRLTSCEIDAPGRVVYHGSVTLEGTGQARLGLHLQAWYSPTSVAFPVEVVFTRSGEWAIPVEQWTDLSSPFWAISPSADRISRCGVSVFWSDTETSPDRFESVGFAEPTYGDLTFQFDGSEGELARLGDGVRFDDWDHPARVWAYVKWFGATVPFSEVWAPDPSAAISVAHVYVSDGGSCRLLGISTELGDVSHLADCDQPLVPDNTTATGETTGAGFDIWRSEGHWYAVNTESGVVVSSATRQSLVELTGALQPYTNDFTPPPEPAADSTEALDRVVLRTFAATDEVERGRAPYGDGYLIFSVGLTHIGEEHRDWIRTYRAHFDSQTWALEQLAEEPWDSCGYARVADDGSGRYAAVVAGLESWMIHLEDPETEGFWFSTDGDLLETTQRVDITDPSGTVRCVLDLAG